MYCNSTYTIHINWICQYCCDWKCFNDLAQFRWSLVVRTLMLCIQVGVLVSETLIFCDYRCFFPAQPLFIFVAGCLQRFSRVTVSCSRVCWWGLSRVRAQNAPGRKVCHHVLSRGWQVFFFGGAGTWSSCHVWMCMWDYLMFLFKDPGEKIRAGWSSLVNPVMHTTRR